MKIYQVKPTDGYIQLQLKNYNEDIKYIKKLVKTDSLEKDWSELEVKVISKGKKTDFPFLWVESQLLVISERARQKIELELNIENIEFLPIKCNDTRYFLIHILKIEKVSYVCSIVEGKVKIQFEEGVSLEELKQKEIFRGYLKGGRPDEDILITDEFIRFVKKSDLKGLDCDIVFEIEE